jgi:hypothetical protein
VKEGVRIVEDFDGRDVKARIGGAELTYAVQVGREWSIREGCGRKVRVESSVTEKLGELLACSQEIIYENECCGAGQLGFDLLGIDNPPGIDRQVSLQVARNLWSALDGRRARRNYGDDSYSRFSCTT